jgi:hypothetical protein
MRHDESVRGATMVAGKSNYCRTLAAGKQKPGPI